MQHKHCPLSSSRLLTATHSQPGSGGGGVGVGGGRVAWSDTSAWVWGGCPASAKTLLLAAEGGREGSRRRWGGGGWILR